MFPSSVYLMWKFVSWNLKKKLANVHLQMMSNNTFRNISSALCAVHLEYI